MKSTILVIVSFIFDVAIAAGSAFFSLSVSDAVGMGVFPWDVMAVYAILTVFYGMMFEMYSRKAENVYGVLLSSGLVVIVCDVTVLFLYLIIQRYAIPVPFWFVMIVIHGSLMVIWRLLVALQKKHLGQKRRVLIVENMHNTSRLARKLKYASNEENQSWYCMIDEDNEEEVDTLINEKIKEYDVIFVSPMLSKETSEHITSSALMMGKIVDVIADVQQVTTLKGRIYQIDDTPVVEKHGIYLSRAQRALKRIFDIVFATVAAVATLPIFAVCAIAIKLDSPGPVIYKQERYTIHKKIFNCYKFRTMGVDAEAHGAQLATENDPRITRVGKILRSLRIDELPQIYDILFGYMSVVGPRPERPVFADEFSKNVANYDMRYSLKAGLTGYAQVYGRYNTRVSDKILMDMIYGTTYSFILDIKIVLLTIRVMFTKSATAGVDEEQDRELSAEEREEKRREVTEEFIGGMNEEHIGDYTGV